MLIIPVVEGLNWRRPPPVTLALIILNCLVFFLYQSFDQGKLQRAAEFYVQSPLPAVELPAFIKHLSTLPQGSRLRKALRLPPSLKPEDAVNLPHQAKAFLMTAMESDAGFIKSLRSGEIIKPDEPGYAQWRTARLDFEALMDRVSAKRFGLNTAAPNAYSWFTSLFLHGDLMHLLGNMVMLFVVGVAVESLVGARWFLGMYLLGGLAGGLLFAVTHPAPGGTIIGASGAVSALMGIFTVVYGARVVNFFYWVIVFIGFRALPGIIMLPVWIASEGLQWLFRSEASNVGYMAHLGGLIGGALLGLLAMRLRREHIVAKHEVADDSKLDEEELERATNLIRKLDFAGAATVLARVVERNPQDDELAAQLWKHARRDPASHIYHRAASVLMDADIKLPAGQRRQIEVYQDYLANAQPTPKVAPATLMRMTRILIREGLFTDAERNLVAMSKQRGSYPQFVTLCSYLADRLAELPAVDGTIKLKIAKLRAVKEMPVPPSPPQS
jgi:membrane associated rhomboid family serine protease